MRFLPSMPARPASATRWSCGASSTGARFRRVEGSARCSGADRVAVEVKEEPAGHLRPLLQRAVLAGKRQRASHGEIAAANGLVGLDVERCEVGTRSWVADLEHRHAFVASGVSDAVLDLPLVLWPYFCGLRKQIIHEELERIDIARSNRDIQRTVHGNRRIALAASAGRGIARH